MSEKGGQPVEQGKRFTTESGIPVKSVYTKEDVKDIKQEDIGLPGQYPFTRGIHPEMYRKRVWTSRPIRGIGSMKENIEWQQYLLRMGETGLGMIDDLPSRAALDPDHPYLEGAQGRIGVSVASLKDMEMFVREMPIDEVSVAWHTNKAFHASAYIVAAQQAGYDIAKLRGTFGGTLIDLIPAFPNLRYLLREVDGRRCNEWRLNLDLDAFVLRHMPSVNLTGPYIYNMREAGVNAVQEVAFAFAAAKDEIAHLLQRGIDINTIGRRYSFTMAVRDDFFEEVAKFRAARRVWAKLMKEHFHATDDRSLMFRAFCHTGGIYFHRQQPLVNIIRATVLTLAGVLGGTQAISTACYDEPFGLPHEHAARIAERTTQVIAHETGIINTVDPLGGSYYIEYLTGEVEKRIWALLDEIEGRGGLWEAMKSGWVDKIIADAQLRIQNEIEKKERVIVGVNEYTIPPEDEEQIPLRKVPLEMSRGRAEEIRELKRTRDNRKTKAALEDLYRAAKNYQNDLMPPVFEAIRAYATIGEIYGVLRLAEGWDYDIHFHQVKYPFGEIEEAAGVR
ncbi:MAG: methylmalonyl-CoA mutase [Chloroflexi bacterium]|nr:methylmalonyl-CoA mutase [Chloroflexota bacterium]